MEKAQAQETIINPNGAKESVTNHSLTTKYETDITNAISLGGGSYIINGGSGSGKSTICYDVIYSYLHDCDVIYYISSTDEKLFKESIANIHQVKMNFENVNSIWNSMKLRHFQMRQIGQIPNKTLIIFDDVDLAIAGILAQGCGTRNEKNEHFFLFKECIEDIISCAHDMGVTVILSVNGVVNGHFTGKPIENTISLNLNKPFSFIKRNDLTGAYAYVTSKYFGSVDDIFTFICNHMSNNNAIICRANLSNGMKILRKYDLINKFKELVSKLKSENETLKSENVELKRKIQDIGELINDAMV